MARAVRGRKLSSVFLKTPYLDHFYLTYLYATYFNFFLDLDITNDADDKTPTPPK